MRTSPSPPPPSALVTASGESASSGGRQRWAGVLAVVAAIATIGLASSIWARSYPLSSDRFADAAAEALSEPAMVAAVAATATDQAVDLVLAVADPRRVLPGPLQNIGSGGERVVRSLLADQMARVVATAPIQRALVGAARSAHVQTLELVREGRSESGVLALDEGVIRLDVTGVLAAALDVVADRGVMSGSLGGLQQSLRDGVDDFRLWVLANTGIDVGEDLGTVVVYDSAAVDGGGLALRSARWITGRAGLSPLAWLTIALIAGAAALGIAVDRWRAIAAFGTGLAVSAIVAWTYWERVLLDVERLVDDPAVRAGVRVIMSRLADPLVAVLVTLAVIGFLAAFIARLARPRPGTRSVG